MLISPSSIYYGEAVVGVVRTPSSKLIGIPVNVWITADPIEVTFQQRMAILSHTPAAARNPELDQTLYLSYASVTDSLLTVTILGTWLNVGIAAAPIVVTLSQLGSFPAGLVWKGEVTLGVDLEFMIGTLMTTEMPRKSWVKWSNIGSLDFTIWKDNVAGERPLDWKGWVYQLKKLGKKVVAYGENGVSFLTPVETAWGLQTISRVGVRSKQAVCGNEFVHFYVDKEGRLCRIGDDIEILDYSEYLGAMLDSVVLSYDELNQLIYICDGLEGYVYSVRDKSMGTGPANVTGAGVQSGTFYVTAAGTISIPVFNLCTDIYDLGNRRNKTIHSMDIGTDLTTGLYAAIDYRLDKKVAFATTPWTTVNPNGVANLPCFGVEFRFRLKLLTYEQFEPDYIRVNGVQHNYSWLDSFSKG